MNNEPRSRRARHQWTAEQNAAVTAIAAAAEQARAAGTTEAHDQLRIAVDAARDLGVGWTRIGDTLGIASGNAYQRYRKRNTVTDGRCGR